MNNKTLSIALGFAAIGVMAYVVMQLASPCDGNYEFNLKEMRFSCTQASGNSNAETSDPVIAVPVVAENCGSIEEIIEKYIGKDFYVFSDVYDDFGYRIKGRLDDFFQIEVLFRNESGLHYVRPGELEKVFYPLIEFGEFNEITNEIREDSLGVKLKNHYLGAAQRDKSKRIVESAVNGSFYGFAKVNKDTPLCAEIYSKNRHPSGGRGFIEQ